jgi:multiple sugar transport system substrate-binding protein
MTDHIHICELEVLAVLKLRVTTAFVALLAVALTSAGCSGNDAEPQANQDNKSELEIWTRRTPASDQEATTKRLAEAFTKKTGIPTKVVAIFEGFETKLQQRASQRDLPDIVINDTAQVGTLVDQGLVREVKKDEIEGGEDISDRAWDAAKAIDGRYYAVPTSAQAFAMFIRKDWREKVGLPQPKSWDDLVTLGKAFTEKDPDGNGKKDTAGFVIPASTERGYASWYWSSFLYQAGGDYFEEKDGKFSSAVASDEAVTAATWFQDLFCKSKIVMPGAVTANTNTAHQIWEAGKAGIYLTGPWLLGRFDKSPIGGRYEVVPAPPGPDGAGVLAEGENVYLMAGSKNESGQEKFAEFAASVEGQEIGMDGDRAGPIVRLPINTKVEQSNTRKDPRWDIFQKEYDEAGVYSPVVTNWTPFRQLSADALNALAANCSADPKQTMTELSEKFDAELEKQGVRA